MRIPIAVTLESRDGTVDKDAGTVNALLEAQGDKLILRKRPGNSDLGLIRAGTAQLLTVWNGINAIHNDYLDRGTVATIIVTGYATWNSADKGSAVTLSNGDLTASFTATTNVMVRATQSKTQGKFYWEVTVTAGNNPIVGIAKSGATLNNYLGQDANGWGYYGFNGNKTNNASSVAYGSTYTAGDVIGVALDVGGGALEFYKNGVSQGVAFTGLSGTFFPAVSGSTGDAATVTANFGASAFVYTPPAGYAAGVPTTGVSLGVTNPGLQYSAQATGSDAATPRLLFKNRGQAWTMNRSGTVSNVTYGGSMASTGYTLLSLTRSGTTATATLPEDAFSVGDAVTIAGATPAAYNATWTVTGTTVGVSTPERVIPITITRADTVATATTVSGDHGLTTATAYTIAGANQSQYNGSKTITVLNATQFTFPVTLTTFASPATGSPALSGMLEGVIQNFAGVYPGTGPLIGGSYSNLRFSSTYGPHGCQNGDVLLFLGQASVPVTVFNATSETFDFNHPGFTSATFGSSFVTKSVAVSSIAYAAGTATLTTSAAHHLGVGWWLTVSGAVTSAYSQSHFHPATASGSTITYAMTSQDDPAYPATGTITVTAPAVSVNPTFTFTITGSPATPATGTITASGDGGTVPGIPYLNGRFYVMDTNGVVWGSGIDDPTSWPALNFVTAQNENGGGKALAKALNYVAAFKEWSTEFFYDAQDPNAVGSALVPVDNGFTKIGCASGESLADLDGALLWIAQTLEESSRSVYLMVGTQQQKVSTPDIDRILDADDLATVYAYGTKENGHSLYVLTLVSSDITLVYDLTSKAWSQRSSLTLGADRYIIALSRSGSTVTAQTAKDHGLEDGDLVKIAGAVSTEYNGRFQSSVLSDDEFTFEVEGSPAAETITPTYATLNSADKGSGVTLSGGNLHASMTGTNTMVRANTSLDAGQWYWEVTVTALSASFPVIGVATSGATLNNYLGQDVNGFGYQGQALAGRRLRDAAAYDYGSVVAVNDVVGVALDLDAGTLTYYLNGVSQGVAFTEMVGTFYPAVSGSTAAGADQVTINFGATAFAYTPPLGHNNVTASTGLTAAPYHESYFKFTKAAYFGGDTLLLHETDGHLYQVESTKYQDAGIPINLLARTVRLDGGTNARKKLPSIQAIGDTVSSNAMIRWSDDDCETFSAYRVVDLSDVTPELRRCGSFQRRTIEFRHVENTPLRMEALELEIGQ